MLAFISYTHGGCVTYPLWPSNASVTFNIYLCTWVKLIIITECTHWVRIQQTSICQQRKLCDWLVCALCVALINSNKSQSRKNWVADQSIYDVIISRTLSQHSQFELSVFSAGHRHTQPRSIFPILLEFVWCDLFSIFFFSHKKKKVIFGEVNRKTLFIIIFIIIVKWSVNWIEFKWTPTTKLQNWSESQVRVCVRCWVF